MIQHPGKFGKKKILITGHTGFKGSWLSLYLYLKGNEIYGISLKNNNKINLFKHLLKKKIFKENIYTDLSKKNNLKKISHLNPDVIFHLASQPLVSEGYKNPENTINSNIIGTQNILEYIRSKKSVKTALFITSDKVYRNNDTIKKKESSYLGGSDIYSVSKSMQDLLIQSYYSSFFSKRKISLAILRAGNILGGGDWSDNRLVVDIIKSFYFKKVFKIRSKKSIRPWLNVFDIINGYYLAYTKIFKNSGIYIWNFSPSEDNITTGKIVNLVKDNFEDFKKIKIVTIKNFINEKLILKLDSKKAKRELGWSQKIKIKKNIILTVSWYLNYLKKPNSIFEFSKKQILSNID